MISPWAPGYNVVGEKLRRNTHTNQVSERSVTTACASNLGDIKVKDIDGVINRGKKVNFVNFAQCAIDVVAQRTATKR